MRRFLLVSVLMLALMLTAVCLLRPASQSYETAPQLIRPASAPVCRLLAAAP